MSDKRNHLSTSDIAALSLWLGVGSVAVVLCGRAMAGALDAPVGPGIPLLATSVALLASLGAWRLFHRDRRRGDSARRHFDGLIALAPVAMIAAASSVNATAATLALLSGLLLCGLAAMVAYEMILPLDEAGIGTVEMLDDVSDRLANDAPPAHTTSSAIDDDADDIRRPDDNEESLHEHYERRLLPGGREEIEAVLIARFDPGQRETVLHLPIHPLLTANPHVECEPLDDSPVTTHLTAAHSYGVRVEVKRSADIDANAAVPIGLLITTANRGVAAA